VTGIGDSRSAHLGPLYETIDSHRNKPPPGGASAGGGRCNARAPRRRVGLWVVAAFRYHACVNIVDPKIEEYLEQITPARPETLEEMERLAARRHFPIVGPLVGRLLFLLTRSIGARHVLECGSGFGYSAWWFAQAIAAGGRVVMTETSAENIALARDFLGRDGLLEKVTLCEANALDVLERSPGPFDIIFCDIDKRDYPRVYPFLHTRLRPGGLFVCDNMLWFGKVVGPDEDDDTKGVRELTRLLYDDAGFVTTLLPLRDGVGLSYRLG
jgi:predicted O-methyltransferase YrrM